MNTCRLKIKTPLAVLFFAILANVLPASALTINLNPNADLAANPAALAAFQRAANQWSSRLTDPITVNIDAGLDSTLGSGILGSTGASVLQGSYDEIRDQLVADSALDPDDGIVASLPTAATFNATLPSGRTLNGNLLATKANLKAMGFTGLDEQFGATDAQITFNSSFDFDYDNRDGSTLGSIDFETVAAHEIGHALGFNSAVDDVDDGATDISPFVLDLYRFRRGSNPSTAVDFSTALRDLSPAQDDLFSDTISTFSLATGLVNAEFPTADGNQASHWKDDEKTGFPGPLIGIMDPSLAPANFYGYPFVETLSFADLRAMDLIGYDFIVPEPTMVALMAAMPLVSRRRRRA